MTNKIYATQDKKAAIICPKCDKKWFKDVSNFYELELNKEVRLKVNCTCGHKWSVILEKRRYTRKNVALMGTYTYMPPGRSVYKGTLEIWDLSLKGMKVKLDRKWDLKIGDWFDVEFTLNDNHRTFIKRKVNVKSISGSSLSVGFRDMSSVDPALGFYLKQ